MKGRNLSRRITHYCVVRDISVHAKYVTMHVVLKKQFSSNSEANALELLENLEELFAPY